jgi:hypothetical protein
MKPAGRFSIVQKQRMRAIEIRREERKKFGVEQDELTEVVDLTEVTEGPASGV